MGKNRDVPFKMSINRMPPEVKQEFLPYSVLKILSGAKIVPNYEKKNDVICLRWNDSEELLHREDFILAKQVADRLWKEVVEGKQLLSTIHTLPVILQLHRRAVEIIKNINTERYKGKKRVILIRDSTGCGYWRMILPARYISDKFYIDVAEIKVIYDYLLEYDTIVVQRLYNWNEYYVLEKLKALGKKIIYDIDDDLFSIPSDNPASKVIQDDQQQAAKAILELSDMITTPSEVLKQRFGFPEKTVVIPNALDLDDGWKKMIGDFTDAYEFGSKDEFKRIFWQGSHTHGDDWNVCIDAVDKVMEKNSNVRLSIFGFLPQQVIQNIENASKPWWSHRVEFTRFSDVETYISIAKQFHAEVAIAPLKNTVFNQAKSCLKFVEFSAIGVPTVASDVTPYKEAIKDGVNGFLVDNQNPEAWVEKIELLLDKPQLRMELVKEARKTVNEGFDIKKTVQEWEKVLL